MGTYKAQRVRMSVKGCRSFIPSASTQRIVCIIEETQFTRSSTCSIYVCTRVTYFHGMYTHLKFFYMHF